MGNYDDYFNAVSRGRGPDADQPQMTRTAAEKEKRKSREEEKRIRAEKEKLKNLEKQIADTETSAAEMEERLAKPDIWQNPEEAQKLTKAYNDLKTEIDRLYEIWTEMAE